MTYQQIVGLSNKELDYRDVQADVLLKEWKEQESSLRDGEKYNEFLLQLRRQWAIETGILERLYDLDDGVTKTLIEQGLDASYITHDRPNALSPGKIIKVIEDQHNALLSLNDVINDRRPLGLSFIRELHQLLTSNQDYCDAEDSHGNEVRKKFIKGDWKRLPNKIGSGSVEPCPPEHVESEMRRLMELFHDYESSKVSSYVLSAWFHHRFSVIHPFEDGNGRVARCLATLVFLKTNWFPLVITRIDRTSYISALKSADGGNLIPLSELFAKIQRSAIRRALSLAETVEANLINRERISSALAKKFGQMAEVQRRSRDMIVTTADTLCNIMIQSIQELKKEIEFVVEQSGLDARVVVDSADRASSKSHYNKCQIVNCAKKLDYYANFDSYKSWVTLSIISDYRFDTLLSIHGLGKRSGDVFACVGLTYERPEVFHGDSTSIDVFPLVDEPFVFTRKDNPAHIAEKFKDWLDIVIAKAAERYVQS
jgi:fido (protein-threonine AMPylation protein)